MTPEQFTAAHKTIKRLEEIKNNKLDNNVETYDYEEIAFDLAGFLSSIITNTSKDRDRSYAQIRLEVLQEACEAQCHRCKRHNDVVGKAHSEYGVIWFHTIKKGNKLYVCRASAIRNLITISPQSIS